MHEITPLYRVNILYEVIPCNNGTILLLAISGNLSMRPIQQILTKSISHLFTHYLQYRLYCWLYLEVYVE